MKCNHALTDANNPTGKSWKHNCALCEIERLREVIKNAPARGVEEDFFRLYKKYRQLIYAVARVFPNETRHETALRYIREAETRAIGFDDCPDAY